MYKLTRLLNMISSQYDIQRLTQTNYNISKRRVEMFRVSRLTGWAKTSIWSPSLDMTSISAHQKWTSETSSVLRPHQRSKTLVIRWGSLIGGTHVVAIAIPRYTLHVSSSLGTSCDARLWWHWRWCSSHTAMIVSRSVVNGRWPESRVVSTEPGPQCKSCGVLGGL